MTRPSKEEVEDLARVIAEARFNSILNKIDPTRPIDYDLCDTYERGDLNELARIILEHGYKPPPKPTTPEDIEKAFQAVRSTQDILLGRDQVGYFEDAESEARVYEPEDSEY